MGKQSYLKNIQVISDLPTVLSSGLNFCLYKSFILCKIKASELKHNNLVGCVAFKERMIPLLIQGSGS